LPRVYRARTLQAINILRASMKTKYLPLFLLSLAVFSPALCRAEVIKLGATLPLSGNLATYGELIRCCIELATDELSKEGIEIKVVYEDIPLSGEKVISGFNRLSKVEKVDGIAGNFSNVAMAAIAPLATKAELPVFHTAANDELILNGGDFVLSTNIRIKDEAYQMAEYLFNAGLKMVAVLSIQTNFGQAYRDHFKTRFVALGGEIVADETFEIEDTDYKSQITKIRSKNPQAVYAACFGQFLGYSLKQAKALGVKAPFFSVYESEDTSVLDSADGAAEGLRYFVTTSVTSSGAYKVFRDKYLSKFGREPGTFGSNAYDATLLLGRALYKCNKDRKCALESLYLTKDFPGVSGTFSIERDGATTKKFVLREVQGRSFVDVQ
jgi:branched-chain amino acid transport system substrate-binding protein